MINVQELRVGNLIQANGPVMEVKAIIRAVYSDHVELYLHGSEADNWDEDLETCTGIPLTPEVLEKCGFKFDNGDSQSWSFNNLSLIRSGDLDDGTMIAAGHGLRIDGKRKCCYIKSLHQLMNLYFALTGQELNYTP